MKEIIIIITFKTPNKKICCTKEFHEPLKPSRLDRLTNFGYTTDILSSASYKGTECGSAVRTD